MKSFRTLLVLALAATAVTSAPSVRAAPSYDSCSAYIDSLPAVITTQGTWCLRKDLSTAISGGFAITIAANNVTLDCNGYKIGGLAGGPGTFAVGIQSEGRNTLAVRNCNIRGFGTGISMFGTNLLVEDNRLNANTQGGVLIDGDGVVVRRNLIADTGGSTEGDGSTSVIALSVVQGRPTVVDNEIRGVVGRGEGWAMGMFVSSTSDALVARNVIADVVHSEGGKEKLMLVQTLPGTVVADNTLFGDGAGDETAMECSFEGSGVRGNTTSRTVDDIVGCVDLGENVHL